MANTIRIKRSTGTDAPSTLENAELAFAEGSKKLFVGIGTGGAGGSATSIEAIGGSGAFISSATTRSANNIFAGPTTGSAAVPTFRSLVAADIPSIAHTKISDFDTGVRVNRLDQMAAPTGSVSANSQKITSLADPTADADAANKGYVDGVAQGLDIKDSCTAATTANITIATALNNGDTLDGVTLSTNDRVLVKDQSTASQNGIYKVGASPARVDDLATGVDAAGAFTFVEQGTVNGDNAFVCSSDKGSAVVGTNNLTFVQFSGAGQITAGSGLTKSGNTLAVDLQANGGLGIASGELFVALNASGISGTLAISDGGTGATSASDARTALGLVIGTNVEAHSDKLTELATMAQTTADKLADLTNTEVAILDGATVSTTELNKLDGLTASTGELNTLDGCLASTSELNILDGATLTTSELNILDGVTSTTAEINKLDGLTATTTELNYIDGVTSAIQTQLDAKQGLDAQLTDVAGLAVTNGGFIVGNGSNFVLETGSTARDSLGLGTMATQAKNNVDIDGGTIDGITIDGGSYS